MSGNGFTPQQRDRRAARTRSAIVEAYNHLFQHRRPQSIKVSDIVARANVGRSTFYEHYAGADAVFLEAVSRPMGLLADAATGQAGADRLEALLDHFWENRQRARDLMSGRAGERLVRLLADLVESRLDGDFSIPRRLVALQLAETALAPVRGWLLAEAPCAPDALARAIRAATAATRAALRTCLETARDAGG